MSTNTYKNPLDFYISLISCNPETFDFTGTSNRNITIIEEDNQIRFDGKSYTYSPNNIFLCKNQNNKDYLFADYKLFEITKDSRGITSASI